ncbi:MAG TPA: MFS transporter [Acidimicrobiales bacterium]|nr:MFS transporter [Acidimicrobiales bacterium]
MVSSVDRYGGPQVPTNTKSRPPRSLAIVVVTIGAFVYSMLQSLVIPALTTIQRDLDTSATASTWVVSSLLVSTAIATPILGRLGDMFGRSHMLVVSLSALAVGCVISATASSIGMLILGRVVQGLGGAAIALAFGIVRDVVEPDRVATAIGFVAAMTAVGAATGIVLSGPIATGLGYRWLFWLPLIVIVPTAIAAAVVIPPSARLPSVRIDWLGALLLSAWLFCLLFGVSEGPQWGWASPSVLGLIVGAVFIFLVWVRVEWQRDEPLVDLRLMRRPTLMRVNAASFAVGFAMQATFTFVPRFVQIAQDTGYGLGVRPSRAGLVALPWSIGSTLTGMLLGRLAARYGPKLVLVAGAIVSAIPFAILTVRHDSIWIICAALGVFGTGTGLMAAAMPTILLREVSADQIGVTTGMNVNIRTIGGAVGTQIVASVIASGTRDGFGSESAYVASFIVVGSVCLLAIVASVMVPHDRPPSVA